LSIVRIIIIDRDPGALADFLLPVALDLGVPSTFNIANNGGPASLGM